MGEKISQPEEEPQKESLELPEEEPKKETVLNDIKEDNAPVVEKEPTSTEKGEDYKYSPEAVKEEIQFKAEKIRGWANEMGLVEGKDFKIIESINEIVKDSETVVPHERRQFGLFIHESHYQQFKEYFSGKYSDERRTENPDNKYGGPELSYSWGGRFAVINDGVFFDTVACSNIENLSIPTHQNEFLRFFKEKTGFDFPTSETLNPLLKEASEKALSIYKSVSKKIESMKEQKTLPDDGYGLSDAIEHAIKILKDAKRGEALIDLPEVFTVKETDDTFRAKTAHYADLTYNAESLKNFDRVTEITGIDIPVEYRIDKIVESIFNRNGFNRKEMKNVCKDFAEYLESKRDLGK